MNESVMDATAQELKDFDNFLDAYARTTRSQVDIALIRLLRMHRESIAPLFAMRDPHWLHKAFRQTEVCEDNASMDMVIWNLIHAAEDFWDEVHWFFSDRKNPSGKRAMQRQLDLMTLENQQLKQTIVELQQQLENER